MSQIGLRAEVNFKKNFKFIELPQRPGIVLAIISKMK